MKDSHKRRSSPSWRKPMLEQRLHCKSSEAVHHHGPSVGEELPSFGWSFTAWCLYDILFGEGSSLHGSFGLWYYF